MDDKQKAILEKYPELPHPGKRLPYGYRRSDDKLRIIPIPEVIYVLDEALDQLDNGISLRDVRDYLNSHCPDGYTLSVMGLRKVWLRHRPRVKRKIVIPTKKPVRKLTEEERLAKKRRQIIADDKRRIAAAQKRIEKAQIDLGIIADNKAKADIPVFTLPISSEIFKEIETPEGINEDDIIFKPNPKQVSFLAASELEVLYGGAAGGGKSYALLADAARYFGYGNFRGLLLRRTNDELKELIWESQKLYPALYPKAKWNQQDKQWSFPSGATLWMTYLEQEKDVLRYQGQSFVWIGFDELTQHPTPFAWNYLRSRLRTKDDALKPYLSMRASTNPGGPGHGWVKRMFIDPAPYGQRFPARDMETDEVISVPDGDPDFPEDRWGTPLFYRRFIPAKLTDNPYLGYEYKGNLLSMPEQERRQLLDGDWNVADGAAFPEFRRSLHVVPRFEVPSTWRRFRSCDFGYSSRSASCVHWYAVDHNETLHVYRELYVKGLTARDLARKVLELEAGESISYGVLDSSCWHQKGHNGPSLAEEMIQAGTRWRPSDRTDGSRKAGMNRIHELLKNDEYTNQPGILFSEDCRHVIATLEVIPIHPDGKDDIDDKYADDHSYDSLRYGVMTRPSATSVFETFNKGVTKARYRPGDSVFGY